MVVTQDDVMQRLRKWYCHLYSNLELCGTAVAESLADLGARRTRQGFSSLHGLPPLPRGSAAAEVMRLAIKRHTLAGTPGSPVSTALPCNVPPVPDLLGCGSVRRIVSEQPRCVLLVAGPLLRSRPNPRKSVLHMNERTDRYPLLCRLRMAASHPPRGHPITPQTFVILGRHVCTFRWPGLSSTA